MACPALQEKRAGSSNQKGLWALNRERADSTPHKNLSSLGLPVITITPALALTHTTSVRIPKAVSVQLSSTPSQAPQQKRAGSSNRSPTGSTIMQHPALLIRQWLSSLAAFPSTSGKEGSARCYSF